MSSFIVEEGIRSGGEKCNYCGKVIVDDEGRYVYCQYVFCVKCYESHIREKIGVKGGK